ncbi:hypothetical protein TVAG_305540 [Trichomonas vaginalis G3]|uniref:Uncharacterized protein n=1 Tax=Trichomonas vaginalis (strain ATCC PRA-98 / G3) TaxID=412133 RepID=A2ERC8_TRIV3|nr:hypothetical protein TVAGG3_1004030 [Trichomonas vaginalis G3]EAY04804.1 hypothetical protein TVAG_305540 [Trichomonas vaginalis G3]KAI5491005.1 hypothetical protein TVAGG3_1004030 [Trichomonas vaginalis G3]|eukprot:XP_001317027.1 hypothetical protein [Trichomonas vaginalis G3]
MTRNHQLFPLEIIPCVDFKNRHLWKKKDQKLKIHLKPYNSNTDIYIDELSSIPSGRQIYLPSKNLYDCFYNIYSFKSDQSSEDTVKQIKNYARHFRILAQFDFYPFATATLRNIDTFNEQSFIIKTLPSISIKIDEAFINNSDFNSKSKTAVAVAAAYCLRELHHSQNKFYKMSLDDIYLHEKKEETKITDNNDFTVRYQDKDYFICIDNAGFRYDPNLSYKDDIKDLGIILEKLIKDIKNQSLTLLYQRMQDENEKKRPSIDFVWTTLTNSIEEEIPDGLIEFVNEQKKSKLTNNLLPQKSGLSYILNKKERSLTDGLIMLATPPERQTGAAEAKFFVDFILSNKYFKFEGKWFVTNGLEEKIKEITGTSEPDYDQDYVDAIAIWNVIIKESSNELKAAIQDLVNNKSKVKRFISESEIDKMQKRHCTADNSGKNKKNNEIFIPLKSIIDLDYITNHLEIVSQKD